MLDFAPGASDTPQATRTQPLRHPSQMGSNGADDVSKLRNEELLGALKRAVLDVRERTAEGIALLAEVAARDLHVKAGYSSLFAYCLRELHFSRAMAWRWSKTARAAAAEATAEAATNGHSSSSGNGLVERLRVGRLSLCTAATLADHPELLAQADFLTREEAVALLAAVNPQLGHRVRRRDILPSVPVAVGVVTTKTASQQQQDTHGLVAARLPGTTPEKEDALQPPPSGDVSPAVFGEETTTFLSPAAPERLAAAADEPSSSLWERLHLDVSGETLRKFHRARVLLPGKSLGDILECALDLLLDVKDPLRRHERRQQRRAKATAATEAAATTTTTTPAAKVRAKAPAERPAAAREDATFAAVVIEAEGERAAADRLPLRPHLSRVMHDAVTARAGGRCEYVAWGGEGEGEKEGGAGGHHHGGRRCTEHAGCEIDHIRPLALGGDNSLCNLRLLCRAHHRLVTKESFPGWTPRRRRPPA